MSQCATTDEFVAVFHPYLERDGLFIATGTPEELGGSIRFVMTLAGGEPILRGEAQVVESHHDKGNFYGLRGMKVRFGRLDRTSEQTLKALQSGPASRASKAAASRSLVECIIYDEPGSEAAEPLTNQASDSPDSSPGLAQPRDSGDDDVTAVAQTLNTSAAGPARSPRPSVIPPIRTTGKAPDNTPASEVEILARRPPVGPGFAVPRPLSESEDDDDVDLPVAGDDEATATAPADQLRSAAVRAAPPPARQPVHDTEVTMRGTPPPELMRRTSQQDAEPDAAPSASAGGPQGKPQLVIPDDETVKMPGLEREYGLSSVPAAPVAAAATERAVQQPVRSVEVSSAEMTAGEIASGEISAGDIPSSEPTVPSRLASVPPGAAPPVDPGHRPSAHRPGIERHVSASGYETRLPSQPPAPERPRRRPVVEVATPTEIVSPLAMQAPVTSQGPAAPPPPETIRAGHVRTAAVSATFGALLGLAAGYFLWGFDQDNQSMPPVQRPAVSASDAATAATAEPTDAGIAPHAAASDAAPALRQPSSLADSGAAGASDTRSAATTVLELTSSPSGAEVELDGVVVGNTPLQHPVTGEGPFEIIINQRGYRQWTRTLDISYLAEPIHAKLRRARKRRR